MADKPTIITVKAPGQPAPDGGARVVLSERHPDHPKNTQYPQGGEVYIVAGDDDCKVALTPAVAERLRDGRFVQLGGNALADVAEAEADVAPRRR